MKELNLLELTNITVFRDYFVFSECGSIPSLVHVNIVDDVEDVLRRGLSELQCRFTDREVLLRGSLWLRIRNGSTLELRLILRIHIFPTSSIRKQFLKLHEERMRKKRGMDFGLTTTKPSRTSSSSLATLQYYTTLKCCFDRKYVVLLVAYKAHVSRIENLT